MLLFVSLTEHLTCNFSLKTRASVPSPLLFLYIYCPSIKGLIPKCLGVKTCFSATHTAVAKSQPIYKFSGHYALTDGVLISSRG